MAFSKKSLLLCVFLSLCLCVRAKEKKKKKQKRKREKKENWQSEKDDANDFVCCLFVCLFFSKEERN